jgi:hypothetical protein
MFGVEFVVDREILFHVGEKHGDIDDVTPSGAGVFEDEPDKTRVRTEWMVK